MIDSIVELPEYAGVKGSTVEIRGERYSSFYSGYEIADITKVSSDGRILMIPPMWYKYKIQLTDYQVNRIYSIIGVTNHRLNLSVPYPDRGNEVEFYPLYVREYTRSGAMRAKNGNVFLWTPGINRLFEKWMKVPVMSVAEAFRYIISMGGVQEFEHVPSEIADNHLDTRFGTLAPYPDDVAFNLIDGDSYVSRGILQRAVDQCCVPEGYFSDRLLYCLHAERFGQLNCLIDPHHADSMLSMCVNRAADEWSGWYSWVHLTDDDAPRYLTFDRSESIAQLLYCASLIPTSDFYIECMSAKVAPPRPDAFNPFTMNRSTVDAYTIYQRLSECVHNLFMCDYYRDTRQFKFAGSYLEELCIYNESKELIGYIDQVWWILATAYGLLNQTSIHI